jgi:hypothetical protein
MKIYLDDERPTPNDNWTRCYWPDEVIELLKVNDVTELSLDHDLGNDARGTGYDVLLWIEERVSTTEYVPPKRIRIHSANAAAVQKMKAALRQIMRIVEERQ